MNLSCRSIIILLALGSLGEIGGSGSASAGPSIKAVLSAENPFARPSTLPFGSEPLGQIKDRDFKEALEVGMAQEMIEVDAVARNGEEPTFENTIAALDMTGQLLNRVRPLFQQLIAANTNETLDKIEAEEAPKLQAHRDAILLDQRLFNRIRKLYAKRDELGLDAKQKFMLDSRYSQFVHAGALLPQDRKTELRTINEQIASLQNEFRVRLLAANKEAALLLDSKEALTGLSDVEIAVAAAAATKAGHAGKYLLTLANTTQQPLMASLTNRALRQSLFDASLKRGEHPGSADARGLIDTIARLRAEKAALLGYPTFAAYTLSDQMARTPEQAKKLLLDLIPAAARKARSEANEIQSLIDQQHGGFKLAAYDWAYYAEQVRHAKYDLDMHEVRQYFEMDHVLKNGVFFAASKMYGLSFKERNDIPTYHPDVRVFDVIDNNGVPLALFMLDPFSRPNKNGGAWCGPLNAASGMNNRKLIVMNTQNFTKPADGQPLLLSFDEVTALFHEFGHALHAMFSVQYYPSQNGFNLPRDAIEFPSQFNEHWALEPSVFANYAHHSQTGAAMPQAMVDKIKKARTFGKGFATMEYLAAALLDIEWHSLPSGSVKVTDIDNFELAALKRNDADLPEIPPRYRSAYFSHIWDGGYAANYYDYMWGQILDDDAFEWFVENGGPTPTNSQRFRDKMLAPGYTGDPMEIYRNFRGRNPTVDAVKRDLGLE